MVAQMKPGSVLVDVAIDQGGCFEGSRPTTHADPTFAVHDSIYYCVANMPGAVPHTSTWALTNATLSYAVKLADQGWKDAMRADPSLAKGLNTDAGQITYAAVGDAFGMDSISLEEALRTTPTTTARSTPPTAVDRAVQSWLTHLGSNGASRRTPSGPIGGTW